MPDIGPAEQRALDFFHNKTAPALSSHFDSEFWTRLVFQVSCVEPAVMHAMVALGAFHEQREEGTKVVSIVPTGVSSPPELLEKDVSNEYATGRDDHFALAQYGKALSELSTRMNSDPSIDVVVLACILFVCVEFLRGDCQPAIAHFKSGMSIVLDSLASDGTRTAATTVQRIKKQLLPFLNRIELLAILMGNEAPWDYPVDLLEAVPENFEGIVEARDSMIHLANLSVRFIRYVKFRKFEQSILPDDLTRQAAILEQLGAWGDTLDRLLLADTVTNKELNAAKTLRMHQIIAIMWLKRSVTAEECINDGLIPDFELAVNLAEAIDSSARAHKQPHQMYNSTFLFDMEIVSPLYYIVTKCRHPVIRRRALRILKGTHRREGLWDSNKTAAVAERVINIEEAKFTMFDGSELPAEEDRVRGMNIERESEIGTNPKDCVVTFTMKPYGIDGPWKTWKEHIVLS